VTAEANTAARPWWWKLLLQLALSALELALAFGLVFAIFTGAMVWGCRALYPACDSTGGLVIVVAALIVGIPLGCAYWVTALRLGLVGRRRRRYALDAVVAAVAIGNAAVL
jgi:hypothetical protein